MEQIKIINEELLSDYWYLLKKYTYEILMMDGSLQQQTREVSFEQVLAVIVSGDIKDARTIMLLQYMKINRIL